MSEVISIVLGISQCLLALVGLTAIYISINNQHNIQKCREIYWELTTIPVSDKISTYVQDKRFAHNIYKKVYSYDLIMTSVSQLTKKILWCSAATLITIAAAWLYLALLYISDIKNIERIYIFLFFAISIILLFEFFCVLKYLDSIPQAAGLPTLSEILDTDNLHSNICSILILGLSVKMRIWYIKDKCSIRLEMPIPLYNYNMQINVIGNYQTRFGPGRTLMLHNAQISNINQYNKYPDSGFTVNILDIDIPKEKTSISIDWKSKQGILTTHFDLFPQDFRQDNFISGIGYPELIKTPINVSIEKLHQPNSSNWGITWPSLKVPRKS